MDALVAFVTAFFFSFIGTIPPGTLNVSIFQLGIEQRFSAAWRFSLAAGIVEYLYAWLAVEFEDLITAAPVITENFQLIASTVMIVLGVVNLRSSNKTHTHAKGFHKSGFRRGILLAILNPLALPFWLAITAYIKSQQWTDLSNYAELHSYLFGVALGGFSVMISLTYLAGKIGNRFQDNFFLKKLPGFTLLLLGGYSLLQYLL
jgi:threonine/homoserine/homoserine lactone efflux protein